MSRFKGPTVPAPESTGTPPAENVGNVLFSVDGETWSSQKPLASDSGGWMTNDNGILLIVGESS